MRSKFVIVDPGLSHQGVHNYTVAMTFSQGAHDMGYEVLWFCHKNLPCHLVPNHVRAEGVFSYSYYPYYGISKARRRCIYLYNAIADHIQSVGLRALRLGHESKPLRGGLWANQLCLRIFPFTREMALALRRYGIGPRDHVLVTTAEYLQYQTLLQLFLTERADCLPFVHVRTSANESAGCNRKFGFQLPRLFHNFLDLGVVQKRIFFYAETSALASHFNNLSLVPFETLENPMPPFLLERHLVSRSQRSERPITILYPGEAREAKGYLRLPLIVSALCDRKDVSKAFRFILQSNVGRSEKKERSNNCAAAREALKRFPNHVVQLVERALSNEEYYTLIAKSDVILLPYDIENYHSLPSGIGLEAALFGKPMVVTKGTTPASFAEADFGGVAGTDEEFAEQLGKVINDYDAYEARTKVRAEKLRGDLDARVLLQRMVDRAQGGCPPS